MQRVNNTRSSHILSLPRILREANDPVRNDHTDSTFSWNKLEVAHPLLPENTGRISHLSRPPLNEYLCLKTELQRSLLTSPKPRVAWEITGYDWPLYHITSGNIFTMRGHKCCGTPIDLNSTGPQFNRSSVKNVWLVMASFLLDVWKRGLGLALGKTRKPRPNVSFTNSWPLKEIRHIFDLWMIASNSQCNFFRPHFTNEYKFVRYLFLCFFVYLSFSIFAFVSLL